MKKILIRRDDISDGRLQMINWAKLKRRRSFAAHYHEDMEEIFIMIQGRVKIRVGRQLAKMTKGDSIIIPQKTIHEMWNIGNSQAIYLAIGISKQQGGKTVVASKQNPA